MTFETWLSIQSPPRATENLTAGIVLYATQTLNIPPPQLTPMPVNSWSASSL